MRAQSSPTDTVPPICAPVEHDAAVLLDALRLWRGEAAKLAEGSGLALATAEAATEADDLSGLLADGDGLSGLYGLLHATACELDAEAETVRRYAGTMRTAADALGALLVERSTTALHDHERRLSALIELRAQELVAVRLTATDSSLN